MNLKDNQSKGTTHIMKDNYITYEIEERDEDITVECPECGGSGTVWAYNHSNDCDHELKCPLCDGVGEYETSIFIDYDEVEEYVTEETEITPYQDDELYYQDNQCYDVLSIDQEEQLIKMMTRRYEEKAQERKKEKEKEKSKILEKIKSLDFSKLENMEMEDLERIAELVK